MTDAIPLAVHLPVDARGAALNILATVVLIVALYWAQPFLITLLLGILFAYTLNPLVVWLERIRIPRVAGTSMVMLVVICALVLGTYALRGQVQRIIAQLPVAASKLSTGLDKMRSDQHSNMKHVQAAANTIEKATNSALSAPSKPRTTHVIIDQPAFRLGDALLVGSQGVLAIIGQAAMVFFLVFFFLLGGDMFKRKLVRLAGPTLTRKKITVHILDDINRSIQKYMFMLLVTNVLVGLLTWVALYWIGLENAGAWAVAAGLLHVIPYVGSAFTAVILGTVAYMQFDSVSAGLLAAGVSLGNRDLRRHVCHDLDDRKICQNEHGSGVCLTAVLGVAVGGVGRTAGHSDHRHREGRVTACRAVASRGGIAE